LSVFDIKMPRYCCGLDWRSYASIVEEVGALFYLKPCFGETKKCILIGTPEDYQIFLTENEGYVTHYFAEECLLGDVYQVDSVTYEQELVVSVVSERLFSDLHCLAGKPCASVALLPYDARLKSIRARHRRLMAALKVAGPMQATYLWVDDRIVLQNISYGQQSCPDTHVFRTVVGMDPSSVYLGLQSGVLAKEGVVDSQTVTGFHLSIPSQPGVFQSIQLPFEKDSYEVLSVLDTGTVTGFV